MVKKVRQTVAKVFKCLFCNHEAAVTCQIDIRSMTGKLECGICGAKFQTSINTLTEPIDIFTEWLDETADLQAETAKNLVNRVNNRQALSSASSEPTSRGGDSDDGEE